MEVNESAGTAEPVIMTGQEVIEAASDYPPMIVTMCYDSAEILAGVYTELRIAEGTRSAELPDVSVPRQVDHCWCVKRDGTIIDPVFSQEIASDLELDAADVQVTYAERPLGHVPHLRAPGVLLAEIRRRARAEKPPLVSGRRRWKFVEKQRDLLVAAADRAAVARTRGR